MAALHLAVIGQHAQMVELLLRFGADVIIADTLGQDVLQLSTVCGSRQVFEILFKKISPTTQVNFDFRDVILKPNIDKCFQFTSQSDSVCLDLPDDMVLKNSPCRPVFNNCSNSDEFQPAPRSMTSSSMTNVFLPSPQRNKYQLNIPGSNDDLPVYNLKALVSPRLKPAIVTPTRGKKRKLVDGFSSFIKRLTKR